MSDGFTFGVPIVPGSDNFSAATPSACDTALGAWTFTLDEKGLQPPPNAPELYFKSGAGLSFVNTTRRVAELRWPEGIVSESGKPVRGADVPPGWTDTETIVRYTVLMVNFTITCNDLGSGAPSRLVCRVCPTPIG